MKLTTQKQEEFNKATLCHICEKDFSIGEKNWKNVKS